MNIVRYGLDTGHEVPMVSFNFVCRLHYNAKAYLASHLRAMILTESLILQAA